MNPNQGARPPLGWARHSNETMVLAWPLVLSFAGDQLLGVVDSLIAGRLGTPELAAVGIGGIILFGTVVIGIGTVAGVEPLAAQSLGAQKPALAWRAYQAGRRLALVSALPFMAVIVFLGWLVPKMIELDPHTSAAVFDYLMIRALAVLPMLQATAASAFLQAHKRTRPIMMATILANLINVPLSMALAFESSIAGLGFPLGFGVSGLAIATVLVSTFRAIYLSRWADRTVSEDARVDNRPSDRALVIRTGWPIGLHWFVEVNVFVAATVLVGTFGAVALAGHQIALQLSTFTFCACLGLSSACSVRVGRYVGQQAQANVKRAGLAAMMLAILLMGFTASLFLLLPETMIGWFTPDLDVFEQAIPIFTIVAVYQIADGIQAVMSGALRGLGQARLAMLIGVFGYWVVGFPCGWWLAFPERHGPTGLWWGLTFGLMTAAIMMTICFLWSLRQPVSPIVTD